jgi:DHA1 family tetracycline resistance protein-like MFS transporter
MTEPSAGAKPQGAAFGFLVATVALDMIAGGIIEPVTPRLARELSGGDAAAGARLLGLMVTTWALMQFVCAPVIGALSDRFGRRPVMLVSLAVLGVDSVIMALAPNLTWLIAARMISGAAASTMATANAYIADVTPQEKRAARFGLIAAAWGVGFVLGPAIGGVLGQFGARVPFWGAAAMAGLNLGWGLVFLRESLPKDRRAPFSVRMANPLAGITFFARPGFVLLGGAIFLTALSGQVLTGTWVPYGLWRYHWSTATAGLGLALVGLGYVLVQALVVGRFVRRFGERVAVFVSLSAVALAYAAYGLAPSTWLFMAAIPLFALGGLGAPGMQAILTGKVAPTEQGRLQGARASLSAIAAIGGPLLFTEVFARSIGDWKAWAPPGSAFFLAGAMLLTALGLAWAATRGSDWRTSAAAAKVPAGG